MAASPTCPVGEEAPNSCGLRFLNRSPAHTRRWRSMSRCGNRAKVRLHQERARQRDHVPGD
ncbi:CGNR zinc finger domain-containing protein [Streptomyces sioyaensis]|uniref:CGNR zinc finger domain-containing protein n=1 Tax=Streptomyces sioyaensis TaxID=67364 RepID=UPI0037D0EF0F